MNYLTNKKKLPMIMLMRKSLGFITGGLSYLLLATSAFAQTIQLSPPVQALGPQGIKLEQVPQFIITLLFVVGIVIAVAFLIYGGIKWILSGGDKTAVEAARNHIIAAIVGLIIVVAAFFIINIVFTLLTGKPFSLSNLCIPSLSNPTCQ